jgi:hypothetical protein
VAFHGLTSLCGEIWQLPVAAEIHRTLWTIVAAGVLLLLKTPLGLQMPEATPDGSASRHRE